MFKTKGIKKRRKPEKKKRKPGTHPCKRWHHCHQAPANSPPALEVFFTKNSPWAWRIWPLREIISKFASSVQRERADLGRRQHGVEPSNSSRCQNICGVEQHNSWLLSMKTNGGARFENGFAEELNTSFVLPMGHGLFLEGGKYARDYIPLTPRHSSEPNRLTHYTLGPLN